MHGYIYAYTISLPFNIANQETYTHALESILQW